jgi:hypothetical protein
MSAVWLRLFNTDRAMLALLPNRQSRSGTAVEISQAFSESIDSENAPAFSIAPRLREAWQA